MSKSTLGAIVDPKRFVDRKSGNAVENRNVKFRLHDVTNA